MPGETWADKGRYPLIKTEKKRRHRLWMVPWVLQGQPLGIDIMYLVLADRNMQVRFGLKVVWES